MPYVRNSITGSIQKKDNKLYAVINLYDSEDQRKRRSLNTGCHPRNQKSLANDFLESMLKVFNEDKYHEVNEGFIDIFDKLNKKNQWSSLDDFLAKLKDDLDRRVKEIPLPSRKSGFMDVNMPFSTFMERWLRTKRNIADNTYGGYQGIVRRLTPFFDGIGSTLGNVQPEDFEEYYSYLYDDELVECTALKHHRLMSQALKYAVRKGPLIGNVLDKVDPPGDSEFIGDYYKASEALSMLKDADGDPLYITVLLTTYYGFRRSEVLGLRWACVDFENNTISVERKIVKSNKDGVTKLQDLKKLKSKSSRRSLPLIPIVAEALKQEYARQQERKRAFGPGYYIDPDKHICVDFLGHPFKPDYVTNHYKVLLKKIGMRIIRFHDLRHTCATLLVMNGISLLLVSKWLGHSSLAVTEKYYLHFDVKAQIESAIKMGEILPHQLTDDFRTFLATA